MRYLLLIGLLVYASLGFADGLSDKLQLNYIGVIEQQIPTWIKITTELALQIFSILWCFETFYQIIFKNVLGNNMKQLPVYIVTRVLFAGFFSYVMLKPDFYLGIIQLIGSKTTGITFSDNTIQGLDAGWVYKQFKEWTLHVYTPQQNALDWTEIGVGVSYALMYVIYLLCTLCITVMIIILEVEIYLTVFGALVLTGFAGSSWTFSLWNKYLDSVIGLGIRVLVFGMLF